MRMATHGKIVYLEIPAADVATSAAFYQQVFGWRTRRRGDGALAFDDADAGAVSGAWRIGRPTQRDAGVLIYVNVDEVADAVAAVVNAGGQVVQGVGGDPGELTARFLDPAGNLLALYQEPIQ
jgi:uncharacterized protein